MLFSAIGSTDPITGQYDGALLHIIRVYKPEKIYLYLSKEICNFEDNDHRYSYCLNKMKEKLEMDFDVKWIRREDLTQVHIFDFFLSEFRQILSEIYNEEYRMLLNVSSGTPAMKSALQILSCFFERPMYPIQVATPQKSINERESIRIKYDPELQWEMNLDNENEFENRCTESTVINMGAEIKKNEIKKHIKAYDYTAALRTAVSLESKIDARALSLIKAGKSRMNLDYSAAYKESYKAEYDMFPVESTDKRNVFEAFMLIKIKLEREDYADFLRAITPVYFSLMEKVINNSGELNLEAYITPAPNNRMIKKWDYDSINNSQLFERANIKCDTKGRVVSTEDYCRLINELNVNSKIKDVVNELRYVEYSVRNTAAHSITNITAEIIEKSTSMSVSQIFNDLKKLAQYAGIDMGNENIRTYERLNEAIEMYL